MNEAQAPGGEPRVLPGTRWVARIILPFLLAAWVILYLFPQLSGELFAWPVRPAMTARLMGSGYLAGAYFFWQAARVQAWRQVKNGFVPVSIFAALMALSTLLHWDRFTPGHPAFLTWAVLYAVTPLLVFAVWLRQQQVSLRQRAGGHDSGAGQTNRRLEVQSGQLAGSRAVPASGMPVPPAVRIGIGLVGAGLALAVLAAYSSPQALIDRWPWTLTPLTARAMLGFILLPALSEVALALDSDWRGWRLVVQGQVIALALILLAALLSWSDFDPANRLTWVILGAAGLILLGNLGLYAWMETRENAGERWVSR